MLVSTEHGLHVRSRRGRNMTDLVPELLALPAGLVLDGELVGFRRGEPYFPLVGRRLLNGDRTVPLRLMILDLLRIGGEDITHQPFRERRQQLRWLDLNGPFWTTTELFDDGQALYQAVCERGLEGVVAKWRKGRYTPGRVWVRGYSVRVASEMRSGASAAQPITIEAVIRSWVSSRYCNSGMWEIT